MADGRPDYRVTPGEVVALNIFAKGGDGEVYSVESGSLGTGRVEVRGIGVVYDSSTHTITIPEDLVERSAAAEFVGVEVTVDGVVARLPTEPDWDRILGPKLAEVQSVQVTVDGSAPPTFLHPNAAPQLRVRLVDRAGRRYDFGAKGRGASALPANRVSLDLRGIEVDPSTGTMTFSRNADRFWESGYGAVVTILPRDDEETEVRQSSFDAIADFNRMLGPRPTQVQAIRVGLADGHTAVADSTVPLVVEVQDEHDRWLHVRSEANPDGIPQNRVTVTTSRSRHDVLRGLLALGPMHSRQPLTPYTVDASYVGSPNVHVRHYFTPDIATYIAQRARPAESLAFHGDNGEGGHRGSDGSNGRSGSNDSSQYGRGSHGSNGSDGQSGTSGGPGGQGPQVRVAAALFESVDGRGQFVVVGVPPRAAEVRVYRANNGRVAVRAAGGTGGNGGRGGSGGDGGRGGNGWSTGNGGDGGSGGTGGVGGPGGIGGAVHALVADRNVLEHLSLQAPGGDGGAGGGAGRRGGAGRSGNSAAAGIQHVSRQMGQALSGQQTSAQAPDRVAGSDGDRGRSGTGGSGGDDGPEGVVDVQLDRSVTAALYAQLPEGLRAVLRPVGDTGVESRVGLAALFGQHRFREPDYAAMDAALSDHQRTVAYQRSEDADRRAQRDRGRALRDTQRAEGERYQLQAQANQRQQRADLDARLAAEQRSSQEQQQMLQNAREADARAARQANAVTRQQQEMAAERTARVDAERARRAPRPSSQASNRTVVSTSGASAGGASSAPSSRPSELNQPRCRPDEVRQCIGEVDIRAARPCSTWRCAPAARASTVGSRGASVDARRGAATQGGRASSGSRQAATASSRGGDSASSPGQDRRNRQWREYCDYWGRAGGAIGEGSNLANELRSLARQLRRVADSRGDRMRSTDQERNVIRGLVDDATRLERHVRSIIERERSLRDRSPRAGSRLQEAFDRERSGHAGAHDLSNTHVLSRAYRNDWLSLTGAGTFRQNANTLDRLANAISVIDEPVFSGSVRQECHNQSGPSE